MPGFDSKMSLYIPRCDTRSLPAKTPETSTEDYEMQIADFIKKQFQFQRIGTVSRVDVVKKQSPDAYIYYIAFVHFDNWEDNENTRAIQTAINTPGERAKLHFHEKWFWILNRNAKPISQGEAELNRVIATQEEMINSLNSQIFQQNHLIMNLHNQLTHMQQLATYNMNRDAHFPSLTTGVSGE
jgi:uncharacterized coiled-coil protein SlyX